MLFSSLRKCFLLHARVICKQMPVWKRQVISADKYSWRFSILSFGKYKIFVLTAKWEKETALDNKTCYCAQSHLYLTDNGAPSNISRNYNCKMINSRLSRGRGTRKGRNGRANSRYISARIFWSKCNGREYDSIDHTVRYRCAFSWGFRTDPVVSGKFRACNAPLFAT